MTTLTIELPPKSYDRLQIEAERLGESAQEVVQEWVLERIGDLGPAPNGDREQVREVLRSAGLLAELGPEMSQRAERSTMTLEEVRAALDRAGGKPLSEVILEMRGPKE
jgi:hypothetical protein